MENQESIMKLLTSKNKKKYLRLNWMIKINERLPMASTWYKKALRTHN